MSQLETPESRDRGPIGPENNHGGTIRRRVGPVTSIGNERCPGVINCDGVRPSDFTALPLM